MRELSDNEMQVLLKGAKFGSLDLREIPEYRGELPQIHYGRCEKINSTQARWSVEHLPITSRRQWDNFIEEEKPNPFVILSKAERNEIIKASISGFIDEALVPSVYPLNPKPILADCLYVGFGNAEELPKIPSEWNGKFRGELDRKWLPLPWAVSTEREEDVWAEMDKDGWMDKDVEGFDFSNGEQMDIDEARFWHRFAFGTMIAIGK